MYILLLILICLIIVRWRSYNRFIKSKNIKKEFHNCDNHCDNHCECHDIYTQVQPSCIKESVVDLVNNINVTTTLNVLDEPVQERHDESRHEFNK
jgi:hypothetical protein